MGYIVRYNGSLSHSSGPWKKHKYVKKIGNKYVYSKSDMDNYNSGRKMGHKAAVLWKKLKAKWFAYKAKATAAFNDYVNKGKQFSAGFASEFAYESKPKPNTASATSVSPTGKKTHSAYAENKAKAAAETATLPSGKKTHSAAYEKKVREGKVKTSSAGTSAPKANVAYPEFQRKANLAYPELQAKAKAKKRIKTGKANTTKKKSHSASYKRNYYFGR